LDDDFWKSCSYADFLAMMQQVGVKDRFRFSVRGEIWNNLEDMQKVRLIVLKRPQTLFWIPTRAWQSRDMLRYLMHFNDTIPNMRILCSIDPSIGPMVIEQLRYVGLSMVFSGDNDPDQLRLTEQGVEPSPAADMYRCEKTWEHRSGHCAVCEKGCFSGDRVEVHLKKHR
jgi:hypothetical protein